MKSTPHLYISALSIWYQQSPDQSVQVWNAKTGEQLKKLQGHTLGVYSVAFSPDGNQIVSGSSDQSVWVWDSVVQGPAPSH